MERPEPTRYLAVKARAIVVLIAAWAWQPGFTATTTSDAADILEPARAQMRLKNFKRAAELLRTQVEHQQIDQQKATAEYLLGTLYRSGLGVEADSRQARQWTESAAMHGNADAAYALAAMLADEPTPDTATIKQWLQRAADGGHVLARKALNDGIAPQRFQPEKSLHDADARRRAFFTVAAQDDVALLRLLSAPDLINAKDEFGRTALAHAARQGASAAAAWLLQAGAVVSTVDSVEITPLMLAASNGDVEVVNKLLQSGVPVNNKDRVGNTALMYAAGTGHPAVAMQLLTAGADIHAINAQGWSVLDWAIRTSSTELANTLRNMGLTTARKAAVTNGTASIPFQHANASSDLYRGWPDLLIAATRSPELVSNVIKLNGNLAQRGPNGETPLLVAVQAGDLAVIDKLLTAAGSALGNTTDTGDSPLSWAVRHNQLAVVQLLLSKGIKPDTHSKTETAPIFDAIHQSSDPMLLALLKAGAATELRDVQGRTPLMLAALLNQASQIAALLNSGADPDASDKQSHSALWLAAANGATDCVRVLLNAKAKVEPRDGNSPLLAAATNGHAAIVDLLLAAGANIQALTNSNTALMLAAGNGHEGIVKRLLSAGARPDVQNKYGDTALMFAARAGQVGVTRILLAAGASTELRNKDRASSEDIAKHLGFNELAALLAKGA